MKRREGVKTTVIFVLDESGSMVSCKDQAIDGTNQFIAEQQKLRNRPPIEWKLFKFSYVSRLIEETTVKRAKGLNYMNYKPNGSTALYDAVGEAIDRYRYLDGRVLLVILTDGEENSSKQYSFSMVQQRIQAVQKMDWTVVFLGSEIKAVREALKWGIPQLNTMHYEPTQAGTQQAYMSNTQAAVRYLKGTESKTSSFFAPNLDNLTATKVEDKLTNVRQSVKVGYVPRWKDGEQIQEFCNQLWGYYIPGRAYYELTKSEKVQANKKVLVANDTMTKIYAGADARKLLKMPAGEVRLKPGYQGNWRIFIQSNSVNRKLVGGTEVIYVP